MPICSQTDIPETNNTPLECKEFILEKCIIVPTANMFLETGDDDTLEEFHTALIEKLIEINQNVGTKEPLLGNPAADGYILSSLTDGTRSWVAPPVGLILDTVPTDGSTNVVESNGIFDALQLKAEVTHTHVEADITDLQAYLTTVVAANINAEASTDGFVLTSDGAGNAAWEAIPVAVSEVNDLTVAVTWANVPDANITQSSVTQHQAALSITQSQISDLSHVVDFVSNVATSTILGRVTAGSGNSEELTATQVRTLLNVADGATANTGTVDTFGTPANNQIAVFVDANTIEGINNVTYDGGLFLIGGGNDLTVSGDFIVGVSQKLAGIGGGYLDTGWTFTPSGTGLFDNTSSLVIQYESSSGIYSTGYTLRWGGVPTTSTDIVDLGFLESGTATFTNKSVSLNTNIITGTKAEFDIAVTDGNFMYIGDAPTAHTHTEADIIDLGAYITASSVDTLTNKTLTSPSITGNTYVSTNGSTFGSPREFGFVDFSTGEAARFQFGDNFNTLETGYGQGTALYTYHTLYLWGGHAQTVTLQADTNYPNITDVAVQVPIQEAGRSFQVKTLQVTPTAPLQVWTNSSDVDVASVDYTGLFTGSAATSFITSGTFADARIAQSNVTQHQAALSITESQISDLGTYLEAADVASGVSTGTTISLTNNKGIYYNMSSANTATSYTTSGTTVGAFAVVRINAASQPTVTGGTLIPGATFATSTDMHMVVQYFGVTVQYFFISLS